MSIQRPGDYPSVEDIAAEQEAAISPSGSANLSPPLPASAEKAPDAPVTWEDRLKAAKITVAQAHEILGQILQQGYYERTFSIYGGKVSVTLRTRMGWHRTTFTEALDRVRSNDMRVHQELEFRHALAGSLVRLGTTAYPVVEAKDTPQKAAEKFENAMNMLSLVQESIVLNALYPLISRFDAAVYAALSQDAPTNF